MSTNDERKDQMKEAQEAPDYKAIALENMQEMELKRGLVAAELDACEVELTRLYGQPYHSPA